MRFSDIKISSASTKYLTNLYYATRISKDALIRFAVCLSLKEPGIPNTMEYNKEGSLLSPKELFGKHENIFLALMINQLKKDKLTPVENHLQEMTRAHINRGLITLASRIKNTSQFKLLVEEYA